MNDRAELYELIADLVRIDSINPDLIAGARGEGDVAAFLVAWAEAAGLQAVLQPVEPGRPNVIIVARGTGGGRTLMLNGHTDTVGIAGMAAPLGARVDGGRLYGRGGYDMKAGLAAALITAKRARSLGLRGDVIVSAVIDEEVASKGTAALIEELDRWRPDAVLVAEPTEMALAVAHKGFAWFDIETHGVAAHGSRPHLGVDAIAQMGKVLVALAQHDRDLRANPTHRHLGSGSLHAGLITGGEGLSTYPARCMLQVERRTIPGESVAQAQAQIQAMLDQCAHDDSTFKATLACTLSREPFEMAEDAPFVQLCQQHLAAITGQPAVPGGVSYWADSALFAAAGLPTVLLGPIGAGAHADVEWVDLPSVAQCADVYTALATAFCQ